MHKLEIRVRKAQPKDADTVLNMLGEILKLHHEGRPDLFNETGSKYSKEQLLEIFENPNRPVLVATNEHDDVVGYCFCIVKTADTSALKDIITLHIDDLYVDPTLRGKNVGKFLLDHAIDLAKQVGAYNIDLNVWEFNENAREFYQHLGFSTMRRYMEIVL